MSILFDIFYMETKNTIGKLYNVGISYKKADVSARGKFSISKENQSLLLEDAKSQGIDGLFVLSTCNRTEVMGYANHPFQLIGLLCKYSESGSVEDFAQVSTVYKEDEAVDHLFRTVTGLESQILGDYEIVAQLKKSFQLAQEHNTINANLQRLCALALQASKQVKNETEFSSGVTSVSYVSIQYAMNRLPDFNDKNLLVLGAGDIGKHTCKNLIEYTSNSSITISNRTFAAAEKISDKDDRINVIPFEELYDTIQDQDVIFVSTSASEPIITKNHLEGRDKEILILDLSIPKNVSEDVKELSNVTLVNVDTLSKVTDETLTKRKQEVTNVEAILEDYKTEFYEWQRLRKHTPAINALKQTLETIQKDGIEYHKKKIDGLDAEQAETISSYLVQKITTQFAKHMRENNTEANQTIDVLQKVFKLEL